MRTLQRALALQPARVEVGGGLCSVTSPVWVNSTVAIVGDGRTAISGGAAITGWAPSPRHPGGKVFVASVTGFPAEEIKLLRLGSARLRRNRWPKLVGDGLTTPNFMFAMPWSSGAQTPDRMRALHQLGVDPATLPDGVTNLSALVGRGYAHILGCVERDVNSQMTRVVSAGGTAEQPTAGVLFRNTFK